MATLAGQSIASSYEQLLHVDRDGGGNTTTLVSVKDGDNGTTFCLQLATTSALINGSGSKLYFSDAGGEYISGDGTDLTITSGADIILAGTAVNITADTIDLSDATKDVTLNAAVDALNFDSNTLSIDASNNRVGIGTAAPVAALDVFGADGSVAGDMKFTGVAGDLSTTRVFIGPWGSDNSEISFDAYGDASNNYFSTDAGSNCQIRKQGDKLQINYDSGVAVDSGVSFNTGMVMDLTNGSVGIGTANPAVTLDVEKSVAGNYIATFTNTHATDGYGILIKAGDDANVRPLTVRDKDNTDLLTVKGNGDVTVSTGNLVIGTDGKGIDFSAQTQSSSTTTAELLDHYEEGTWSPLYGSTSGSFNTMTMDIINASYTRIGRQVTVTGIIRTNSVNASGASGGLKISGLPFTALGSNHFSTASIGKATAFASGEFPRSGYTEEGNTYIVLTERSAVDGADAECAVDTLTTGVTDAQNYLIFSALYYAA
jgi:hypothetical protein